MFLIILIPTLWIGFTCAVIAFYGRYHTLPSFVTGPNICQMESGGCQILFRAPNASLLGVPNSLLGIFFYPLIGLGVFLHIAWWILFAASTLSFFMSLWLSWILVRDKLECRVCWTGHVCNTVLWIVLLKYFLLK